MKFLHHLGNKITDPEKGNPRVFLTSTMELENLDFRAMIYYDLKSCLTYHESYENLCEADGSIEPRKSSVSKWFCEFGFGRSNFNDDNRCCRTVSAAIQENAAGAREPIREKTRITCKDLQDITGIGMSVLNKILHHKLGLHKQFAT